MDEIIPRNDSVTIGATATDIAKDLTNYQRVIISITNNSTAGQVFNISVGQDAIIGYGIQLGVGANYTEALDPAFKPSNMRFSAISSAVGGTLAIHERIQRIE